MSNSKLMKEESENTEEIYLAGGCLWGVQEFVRHLPGVIHTEAGRANGTSQSHQWGIRWIRRMRANDI